MSQEEIDQLKLVAQDTFESGKTDESLAEEEDDDDDEEDEPIVVEESTH